MADAGSMMLLLRDEADSAAASGQHLTAYVLFSGAILCDDDRVQP